MIDDVVVVFSRQPRGAAPTSAHCRWQGHARRHIVVNLAAGDYDLTVDGTNGSAELRRGKRYTTDPAGMIIAGE